MIRFLSMAEHYFPYRVIPYAITGYRAHLNTKEAYNDLSANELLARLVNLTEDNIVNKGPTQQ